MQNFCGIPSKAVEVEVGGVVFLSLDSWELGIVVCTHVAGLRALTTLLVPCSPVDLIYTSCLALLWPALSCLHNNTFIKNTTPTHRLSFDSSHFTKCFFFFFLNKKSTSNSYMSSMSIFSFSPSPDSILTLLHIYIYIKSKTFIQWFVTSRTIKKQKEHPSLERTK